MKYKILIFVALLFISIVSNVSAGCSPDGDCLIQINSHKEFVKFINDHPYQIELVDYKWFIGSIYYVWYKTEDNNEK